MGLYITIHVLRNQLKTPLNINSLTLIKVENLHDSIMFFCFPFYFIDNSDEKKRMEDLLKDLVRRPIMSIFRNDFYIVGELLQ